jgi:hypothetical protein
MVKRLAAAVLGCLLVLLVAAVQPPKAAAHVLLHEARNQAGAVLHMTPDDDPIVYQPSSLYITLEDSNNQFDTSQAIASLTIKNIDSGETWPVAVVVDGKNLSAQFTFLHKGLYAFDLRVRPNTDGAFWQFRYTQRISRGDDASMAAVTHQPPLWAEAGLVVSGTALLVLAILGLSRRRDIARQSAHL